MSRLEEIKEHVQGLMDLITDVDGNGVANLQVIYNDMIWLIEQAGRVQELEKENKRLEDFIETIQNVHFVELQREKAENRRYREVINNINEKAMLYGVDEEVYEAIKEAIRVLEESR